MAITFHTLRYKNFLSSGNIFTEIHLDKYSTTLIVGTNGAGKSTILDALCFVLFNKPFRSINRPQLINSINEKDALVEVNFSIGKKQYLIRRGIKPNIFEIYINRVQLEQDANVRDFQDFLEKHILKLNYKSFTQIVVLGSSSFIPFMQLKTQERRTIIEDLLDIQIFSSMNFLLKQYIIDNKQSLATIKHKIEQTNTAIDLKTEYIKQLSNKTKTIIDNYNKEIEKNQQEKLKLNNEISTLLDQVTEKRKYVIDKQKIKNKQSQLQTYKHSILNKINSEKKNISFYENNNDCPTCKQNIEHEFKQAEIEFKTEQIIRYEDGLRKLTEELDVIEDNLKDIQSIQKDIDDIQSAVSQKNHSIIAIEQFCNKISNEISKLKQNDGDVNEEKLSLKHLQQTVKKFNKEHEQIINDKDVYDTALLILKDNGIKTRIIKQYLPIMNKLINKYLSDLNFFASFHLDESFNEIIKSRHRDDFTYTSFSEGEKQRIDLALLLTWRAIAKIKNSTNTNLLIMDEIFDSSLDTEGTEYLMKILDDLAKNNNIFIISHKSDLLYDKFKNILQFKKSQNFSVIA